MTIDVLNETKIIWLQGHEQIIPMNDEDNACMYMSLLNTDIM